MTDLLAIRWLPYAAIAVVVACLGLFGYGYMKGSEATEVKYLSMMNDALARQIKVEQAVAKTDLVAVTVSAQRRAYVAERFRTITKYLPARVTECRDPEWLRVYNDGVRAAQSGAGAAN